MLRFIVTNFKCNLLNPTWEFPKQHTNEFIHTAWSLTSCGFQLFNFVYFFLNYFLYILIPLGLGNKQSTSCKTINNGNSIIQKLKSDYRLITFQGTKTNFLPPNLIIVSINIPIACVTKILLSQVLRVGCDQAPGKCEAR